MTDRTRKPDAAIFSGREPTEDFLFNPPVASATEVTSSLDEKDTREALQQAFPDIPWSDDFIQKAMEQVQPVTCFGTLIVRVDPGAKTEDGTDKDEAKRIVDIGRFVAELCQREHGTWGAIDTESIGCFLPGKNDADTLHLAKDIQIRARGLNSMTVSIGIASYPKADYAKADIFENAKKALTHASFFGADSAVMFDAVSLNISGDECYQQGDVPGAIAELKQALKLDPNNINILNSLGVCYGVSGDTEKALAAFKKVIQIDPNEIMAYYNAGYVYGLKHQPADALKYYQQAEAIDQNVFEVTFQIGKLYLDQADSSTAKTYFEKALTLQPESWITNFHLGECCEVLNMHDEAILYYEAAVKRNPKDACALSALGTLYADKAENPEISTLFCKKAVEMSPENGLFHYRLGKIYVQQKQLSKAVSAFKRAVELGHPAESEIDSIKAMLQL
jgi:tetratricopeptide (TPR) repeat protein